MRSLSERACAVAVLCLMASCGSGSTLPQDGNARGPSDASAASVTGRGSDAASNGGGSGSAPGANAEAAASSAGGGSAVTGNDSGSPALSEASEDAEDDSAATADGQAAATACTGGTTFDASNAGARAQVDGFGSVRLVTSDQNEIVAFDTTLTVPTEPAPKGTLFLWPGLQPNPGGANFATLNNGVLQPVLTWGPTCAPTSPANPFASWWISAQYVNTFITDASANFAAYAGCHGGPGMDVAVGDSLNMTMTLSGSSWVQTVTDARTTQSVSFTIDMMGQAQNLAEFVIEDDGQAPVSDVIFTSTTITFASSQPAACQPQARGTNDYFSAPQASIDGLHCCISKVILRAQGVAATSPDTP